MFLTEEQAAILIIDRGRLAKISSSELRHQLTNLKSGCYTLMMDTGARLQFDKSQHSFYIWGYDSNGFDVISLYDHLDLLDDYSSWFLSLNLENGEDELEKRKSAYKSYKLRRLQQVA